MKNENTEARKIFAGMRDDPMYPGDLAAMNLASAYGIRCEIPVMAANLEEARSKAVLKWRNCYDKIRTISC